MQNGSNAEEHLGSSLSARGVPRSALLPQSGSGSSTVAGAPSPRAVKATPSTPVGLQRDPSEHNLLAVLATAANGTCVSPGAASPDNADNDVIISGSLNLSTAELRNSNAELRPTRFPVPSIGKRTVGFGSSTAVSGEKAGTYRPCHRTAAACGVLRATRSAAGVAAQGTLDSKSNSMTDGTFSIGSSSQAGVGSTLHQAPVRPVAGSAVPVQHAAVKLVNGKFVVAGGRKPAVAARPAGAAMGGMAGPGGATVIGAIIPRPSVSQTPKKRIGVTSTSSQLAVSNNSLGGSLGNQGSNGSAHQLGDSNGGEYGSTKFNSSKISNFQAMREKSFGQ
jgi:hypothetical protein